MKKVKYLIWAFFGLSILILGTQKIQAADSDVVINEVMAHPPAPQSDLEWIELYNNSSTAVSLNGWILDGKPVGGITDPLAVIQGNNYLILARNKIALEKYWENNNQSMTVPVVQVSMGLTDGIDTIVLQNKDGSYKEEFSWNSDAGFNISWEKIDPLVLSGGNWQPSFVTGGTPGAKNSVSGLIPPVLPTLLAPQNNMELANTTSVEFKWQIQNGLKYEFILSKSSDFKDFIYDEPNLVSGEFTTEDLELGTYYWKIIATNGLYETPSAVYSFEILPPVYSDKIIINELYPDPASGQEWVELYNNSAERVDLKDWVLEDEGLNRLKILNSFPIQPFGFAIIFHTDSRITLNNDGDLIKLFDPNGKLVSSTPKYSGGQKGWSFARGSTGTWAWSTKITPGAENIIKLPIVEETAITDPKQEDIPKNTLPIEIKTGEVQNYENYLVKVKGEVVETSGNTFWLDDGSGKVKIYIQASTGIDKPSMRSGDIFEVAGIVNLYRSTWRILPQKQDNILLIEPVSKKQDDEKATTAKKSVAAKVASSTKTAAPTKKTFPKVASASDNGLSQGKVEGAKISLWIQLTKLMTGLTSVLLIILIVKLLNIRKTKPLGGSFGDDYT